MRHLFPALALMLAAMQPALADSCWSAPGGNRLAFTSQAYEAAYTHAGMVEPCNLRPLADKGNWGVWCDVSSISGVAQMRAARPHQTVADFVLWDGQIFYRDPACK